MVAAYTSYTRYYQVFSATVPVEVSSFENGYDDVRGGYRGVSPPLLQLVVNVPENRADVEQNLHRVISKRKDKSILVYNFLSMCRVHEQQLRKSSHGVNRMHVP